MNQWTFVTAAYLLTLVGTAGLVLASFVAMRHAERGDGERSGDR